MGSSLGWKRCARPSSSGATVSQAEVATGETRSGGGAESLLPSVHFITHKVRSDTEVSQHSWPSAAVSAAAADMPASTHGRVANAACVNSSRPIRTWHIAAVNFR